MIRLTDASWRAPDGRLVLDAIRLDVAPGEAFVVLGPAAAGKSVLLDLITGIRRPASGAVTVGGHDATGAAARRLLTWTHGFGGLEPTFSVRRNLRLIATLCGLGLPDSRSLLAALRRSDVPDRALDRPAAELQADEEWRVWIAASRLRDTPVVLCDDPTARLPFQSIPPAADLLRDLRDEGRTVVIATRDAAFADRVGDRVGVLQDGRLAADHSLPARLGGGPTP